MESISYTQKPSPAEAINFFSLTLSDLEVLLTGRGKEKFRAEQLFRWVYGQRIHDLEKMSNLSKGFRQEMRELLKFELPPIVSHLKSMDGTQKLLLDVGAGNTIEAVLIPSDGRLTLCVSSEIGCNMACKFCYTGKQKLKRRLTAAEIVGQFLQASYILPEGTRITNIVFMGMGEPLDNPDAVFKAIEILHSPWGINLSKKKMTVSTSGLVPMIPLVTKAGVRLAVSLNGSNDEIRARVMPINLRYPIEELFEACRQHARESGDKITVEYVLLKDVTDSIEDARRLAKLSRKIPCKINIIPFNEHPGSEFMRPSSETVKAFQEELMRLGVHVLLRKTMGRDIYAACGQLTSLYENRPMRMNIDETRSAQMRS